MISSSEACVLSNLDPVERAIRDAAYKGKFMAQMTVQFSKVTEYKAVLESKGFKVTTFEAGYSVNGEDGWTLAVSW